MTFGQERFPLWGGVATVMVEDLDRLSVARRAVDHVIADIDAACGAFRGDSDLARVNAGSGRPVPVGATFHAVLWTALHAAELTGGLVDPVVGAPRGDSRSVVIDEPPGTVTAPAGTTLDLWPMGTAFAADRAAESAAGQAGCGVFVSLPGAIAVAGPVPAAGWSAQVPYGHGGGSYGAPRHGEDIVLRAPGGLATSSLVSPVHTTDDGRAVRHPLDPRSAVRAHRPWRTVSVIGLGCVAAKTASIAALVSGHDAAAWLSSRELRARMVHADGRVATVGCWPAEPCPATAPDGDGRLAPACHSADPS
ncbi:FAD:protein FMN transferase [Actinomadura sp. 3N407]|uniref:FAD:protein FMN transferase n=1 Tax=Actinomadura sp. 3N407 TaxID=3457423 RepID=UPI003FCD51B1